MRRLSAVAALALATAAPASDGGGGGGGGGSGATTVRDIDLTTAATAAAVSSGSHTSTDGDGDAVGFEVDRISSSTGDYTQTSGTGGRLRGVGSNSTNVGYDVKAVLDGESVTVAGKTPRVAHLVLSNLDLSGDIIVVFNTSNASQGRGLRITSDGSGGCTIRTREGTAAGSSTIATFATTPSQLVVSLVLVDGNGVRVKVTSGATPPTDAYDGSSSAGRPSRTQGLAGFYESALVAVVSVIAAGAVTVERIVVETL